MMSITFTQLCEDFEVYPKFASVVVFGHPFIRVRFAGVESHGSSRIEATENLIRTLNLKRKLVFKSKFRKSREISLDCEIQPLA